MFWGVDTGPGKSLGSISRLEIGREVYSGVVTSLDVDRKKTWFVFSRGCGIIWDAAVKFDTLRLGT